jgi:hypothetical protein
MGFIRINNRKNFLIDFIPDLHPKSREYLSFWREQKRRCIEGFWGIDAANTVVDIKKKDVEQIESTGSWRWMPPNLYFYVNYGIILHKPDGAPKTAPKKKIRPDLRDFEWEFFYNYMECRGFSGFRDDEEHCCLRDLDAYLKGDEGLLDKLEPIAFNSKGELKKYMPAREYLRKLWDRPMGLPDYNNEAKNLFLLGARGGGKSYLNAVGVILFEIIFDGARYYTSESIREPSTVEVFVGAAMASKSGDILKKTQTAMLNLPGAWGTGKEKLPAPFYKEMRGSLKSNNVENPWRHEYEKKTGGNTEILGSGSNIKHGTYTVENPEAAAGTRPGVMVIEEVGLLGNVLVVHASNEACQMTDGTVKFGTSIYIGTGGNVEKIQEAEIIFRDPEAYNFLSFEDEWEQGNNIGWFVPAYYMDGNFKDKNGNTMVEAAIDNYEKRREKKRKANSSAAIDGEMMNYPLKPSEMFLNARGSIFPLADLKVVEANIKTKKHEYEGRHWFGELVLAGNGSIKWKNTSSQDLVREWPIKDNKSKPGVIEIAEMPKRDAEGIVIPDRYIAGTDTYDDDESSTKSLGSIFILDTWTDRIVAEYTGRRLADDFYEITRRLCIFYRALNNYEQNKKGLYAHYKKMNSVHMLAETPEILRDVANVTISKIGNRKYGTTATPQVNAYALRLILRWLTAKAYGSTEGEETQNMHKLRFLGAVKELISHNPDGNYDRVSALGMLMILKEDKFATLKRRDEQKVREKGLEQDEFFTSRWITPN